MSVFNGKAENIEDNRNKTNKIIEADETKYPSCKAVVDYVNENVETCASVNYVNNNFANALKGNKSSYGTLTLDDISPIEHELKVQVFSKNLVKFPYSFTEITSKGVTFVTQADGGVKIIGTLNEGVTSTDCNLCNFDVSHLAGKTLCVNHNYADTGVRLSGHLHYNDGTATTYNYYRTDQPAKRVLPLPENASYITFSVTTNKANYNYDTVVYPQLEIGTTPTEYSMWVDVSNWTLFVTDGGEIEDETTKRQQLTINEDGTVEGAKSYYPTTSIWNNAEGQTFTECEYNRDLNKAFEELTQVIISLGGNI